MSFFRYFNLLELSDSYDIKSNQRKFALIDLENPKGLTYELINIAKNYLNNKQFYFKDDRQKAEFLLLTFFEFLFSKYLSEAI